jgi:hypothetical protein
MCSCKNRIGEFSAVAAGAARKIVFLLTLNEPPVRLRNRSTFDFVHKLLRRLTEAAQ